MFDIFIDSSEVGMRKPERGIYELAVTRARESVGGRVKEILDATSGGGSREALRMEEIVMLDDLGMYVLSTSIHWS